MIPAISSKLPPAEKAFPAPRSRATLVSGSLSTTVQTSASCRWTSGPTELSPGPSSVMRRTPSLGRSKVRPSNSAYRSVVSLIPPVYRAAAAPDRVPFPSRLPELGDGGPALRAVEAPEIGRAPLGDDDLDVVARRRRRHGEPLDEGGVPA